MSDPARPRGVTMVELVIATVCLGLLLSSLASAVYRTAAVIRAERMRMSALTGLRTARVVLRSETGSTPGGVDWAPHGPDSLALRAVRGHAWACRSGGRSGFSYRGSRAPDPGKDSVLALDGAGRWYPARLDHAVVDSACGRWTIDPPVPSAAVLVLFERGSYHLAAGAFRYRSGGGGRQPLTESTLAGARLEPVASGATVTSTR